MKKQKGFGLLEILITLVLLGVGVAGLVALARGMLSASQEGGRYEVAMRLAESKLDEFRNFNGVVSLPSGATGTLYKDIVASSTPQTVLNDYSVSWTVSNQYLNSGAWSTTNSAGVPYPDRKVITVTVGWSDNGGANRSLQLAGALSPTGSFTSEETGDGLVKHRDGPKVDYTKGSVPDVVAIALGDDSNKETSKPLPNISGSTSRLVQFDTNTYTTANNSSKLQAVQDNMTAYCSCKSGNNGKGYLPAVPQYISSAQAQYWKPGIQVDNKPMGQLKDGTDNDSLYLCATCCKQHYDVSDQGFSGYYAPLNTGRARYILNNNTLIASSGDYQDACRFIRIDGYYTPAPDWRLASLSTFSASFLDNATNLKNYQDYVAYVVKEFAWQQISAFTGKDDSTWTAPSFSPNIQDFNTWMAANRSGNSTAVVTAIGAMQLISRGIYVDIMSPDYLKKMVYKGKINPGRDDGDLARIPFQDVNMTLLNNWCIVDGNTCIQKIPSNNPDYSITNENMSDPDKNNVFYSRGLWKASVSTISGSNNSPRIVKATSYQGNSGVIGTPVLPEDISAAMTSTMQVSVLGGGAALYGIIECLKLNTSSTTTTDSSGTTSTIVTNQSIPCADNTLGLTITNNNPTKVNCKILEMGAPAKRYYACSGTPNSAFTLTLSRTDYQVTPASQAFTLPASGTSAGGCVMMVDSKLLDLSLTPQPIPTPTTTCSTTP